MYKTNEAKLFLASIDKTEKYKAIKLPVVGKQIMIIISTNYNLPWQRNNLSKSLIQLYLLIIKHWSFVHYGTENRC